MIKLDNVTIVYVDGVRSRSSLNAIKKSMEKIDFHKSILITSEDIEDDVVQIQKIPPINYEEYNKFIVYELYKYIDTDYALIIQDDGYVINPQCWRQDFLNYDYIGAAWNTPTSKKANVTQDIVSIQNQLLDPNLSHLHTSQANFYQIIEMVSFRDPFGNLIEVGNGGFSLRSKKLLELPSKLNIPWRWYYGYCNEDGFISVYNRHILESNGCKFAPVDIAILFSHETEFEETKGIVPFGFHGKYTKYYKPL